MIRMLCVFLVVIAVFWACFSPTRDFNLEYCLERTASISARVNPLHFIKEFAGNIKADVTNAVAGFHQLSDSDNVVTWLRSFFPALGDFFENAFYVLVDITIAPMIFVVDVFVIGYNLLAIWLGFPETNIWLEPINRIVGGGRGGA